MHANTLYNGDCYAYWKVRVIVVPTNWKEEEEAKGGREEKYDRSIDEYF